MPRASLFPDASRHTSCLLCVFDTLHHFRTRSVQIPAIKPLRLPLIEPNMLELLIISVFRSWNACLWIDVCPTYLVYQTELIQIPCHRARLVQDISRWLPGSWTLGLCVSLFDIPASNGWLGVIRSLNLVLSYDYSPLVTQLRYDLPLQWFHQR